MEFITSDTMYYDFDKECYMSADGNIAFPVSRRKKVVMRKLRKKMEKEFHKAFDKMPYYLDYDFENEFPLEIKIDKEEK